MLNRLETRGPSGTRGTFLPSEVGFRRPDFLGGRSVRLADGREWAFPGPEEIREAGQACRTEVSALVRAIIEAEDEADRLRGELALAIGLLALNYHLTPADYSRLLACRPGDPALTEMQIHFRDLACRHAEELRLREGAPAIPPSPRAHQAGQVACRDSHS